MTLLAGTAATKTRAPSKLTIDELIQIKHPSGAQWTSADVIAGRLGELARRRRSREAISAAITGTTTRFMTIHGRRVKELKTISGSSGRVEPHQRAE